MVFSYSLDDCGLFWYDGRAKARVSLPLDGVHVSARIVNMVAEVQIVQFYVNHTNLSIETSYTFPLDESAAVCGFEAELEDKLLIGEVREKEEARQEYNAAIARGETAALLEQNKPDMFVQTIGNIPPHSRINIRITYVADLKVEADGSVRFVLPTSVAPRYSPYISGPIYSDYVLVPWARPWYRCCLGRRVLYYDDYVVWRRRVPTWEALPWHPWNYYTPEHLFKRDSPCAFSVTIEIEMPSAVANLESPTHTLKWERTASGAVASFWYDNEPMGKDLVLRIAQEKPHEPHAELEVAPDGSGCAMVSMVPDFDLEPEPTEIIFLVDCSGSMAGSRMTAAKSALSLFVRALPSNCYFNIFKFGSRYVSFWGNSNAYTESTLNGALNYINSMNADLGGTELKPSLEKIFSNKVAVGRGRQVFVLTDGQVSNTEQVIEACRRNAHNSRVFTVGIGDEVSRHLVEGMARGTAGTAEFIQGVELNSTGGALERKLLNQLKLATQPSITKVLVEWGQLGRVEPTFTTNRDASAPAPETTPTPSGPSPTGPASATFQLNLRAALPPGDSLWVVGGCAQLGAWQTSAAQPLNPVNAPGSGSLLGMFGVAGAAAPAQTEFRSYPIDLPAGSQEFKFIRRQASGSIEWEQFAGNRVVSLDRSALVECGMWSENHVQVLPLSSSTSAAPTPAATAFPQPSAPGPQMSSGGPMMSSVPIGSATRPVSKFFQTGGRTYNPNAVGSGPQIHAANQLAPQVGYNNDASGAQALGRNESFYQAPFLPPPIFSGARFVMYAFFKPGACPTSSIRITAEGPGGDLEIDVPITKLSGAGRTLHTLAARALIRDLEEGTSHLHWRKSGRPAGHRGGGGDSTGFRGWLHSHRSVGGKGQDRGSAWKLEPVTPPAQEVRAEIIQLGVQYGLTSKYTSFVAVETWRDGRSGSSQTPLPLPSQAPPQAPPQAPQAAPRSRKQFSGPGGAQSQNYSHSMSSSFSAPPPPGFGGPPQQPSYGAPPPFSAGPSPQGAFYGAAPTSYEAPAQSASFGYGAPPPPAPASWGDKGQLSPRKSSSMAKSADKKKKLVMKEKASEKEGRIMFDRDQSSSEEEYQAPVNASSLVPGVKATDIINFQAFDGCFPASRALWDRLGRSISPAPVQLAGITQPDVLEKLLTTAAVLAFLENTLSSQRELWDVSAEKARNWAIGVLSRTLGLDRAGARRLFEEVIRLV